jgi:hypothetical protein
MGMRVPTTLGVLFLAALACSGGPAPAAPQSRAAPAYTVFQRVSVVDPSGFDQPREVFAFLVPADWKVEQHVEWMMNLGCPENAVQVSAKATAPDGVTSFEVFPSYIWGWYADPGLRQLTAQSEAMSGQPGCEQAPPVSAQDYLEKTLAPAIRPGASVVTAEAMPDVENAFEDAAATDVAGARQLGMSLAVDVSAARVRVDEGTAEDWLSGLVTTYTVPAITPYGMPSTSSTSSAAYLFAMRAPKGKLDGDAALFAQITSSLQLNNAWYAAVNNAVTGIRQTQIRGAADRARIWAQTADEISDIQRQSWADHDAAEDGIAAAWSQERRGVESYDDRGAAVEIPAGYTHAWSDGNGQYVVTDDPSFDVNALNGTWHAIERR